MSGPTWLMQEHPARLRPPLHQAISSLPSSTRSRASINILAAKATRQREIRISCRPRFAPVLAVGPEELILSAYHAVSQPTSPELPVHKGRHSAPAWAASIR